MEQETYDASMEASSYHLQDDEPKPNRHTRRRNRSIERRQERQKKRGHILEDIVEAEQERIDNLVNPSRKYKDKVVAMHPTKGFRYRNENMFDWASGANAMKLWNSLLERMK